MSHETVILHIKHSMSHAPSMFPSQASTTSLSTLSTNTPVRPSTRRTTRPLLTSSSYGNFPCAEPSNVSSGPMAEATSLAGYEPNATDLIEVTNIEVKPMFFQRPSMTSTYDSAESICGERSKCRPITSSSLFPRILSVQFISLPRKCRETCRFVLTQKESRVKKYFYDRECMSSGHQPVQGQGERNFLQVL